MEEEDPTHTEMLEAIGIHFITPLFTETLLDIIKNITSSFFTSSLFNEELQTYLLLAIHKVETTRYLIP